MLNETVLWEGKPFNYGVPSFIKYTITDQRLIVDRGVFTKKREEIRLYRIRDISLKRNLMERIVRVGDLLLYTTDTTTPTFLLKNIRDSIHVSDLLSEAIEVSRLKYKAQELTEIQAPLEP
ncbi:PH domain-containing protein [Paenibacillus psychroresistens]|uniref:PH domain-containing protein n=1 Tax=Paenibacillus psychroresistens TaxID=1778678 RepID=A0A6B8RSL4_9BACL|nr:PH domain-containing protein [Paenibacillus psychroresistens]QGQ98453.1 PH domain-containing protein [Paenibacillus psychroresistens]